MGKQEILEAIGYNLVRELREQLTKNGSVITGNLRRSIYFKVEGDTIIIKMADYGKNVEFGSSPHIIRPKSKKALKFKSGSEDVFAKKVNHPGSRAKPFIRPTLHQKLGKIIQGAIQNYGNS